MGYGDVGERWHDGWQEAARTEYWDEAEQGRWGPNGTRVLRVPDPREYRHGGGRVARRVVLAALGGVLITGTTAVAAAANRRHPEASGGGQRPATGGTATPRHGGTAGRRDNGGPAGPRGRTGPQGGGKPAKPVYYIDDGPMTVALTIDDGPGPVYTPQILQILAEHGVTA